MYINIPERLNDYTIFHYQKGNGQISSPVNVILTDSTGLTVTSMDDWTMNIINGWMSLNNGSLFVDIYQTYMNHNPVFLAISEGPYKVVQSIEPNDAIFLKSYLRWKLAQKIDSFRKAWPEISEVRVLELDEYESKFGDTWILFEFVRLTVPEYSNYCTRFLDPANTELSIYQRWYYLHRATIIKGIDGGGLTNEQIRVYKSEHLNFVWDIYKKNKGVVDAEIREQTQNKLNASGGGIVTGRRGSTPTQVKMNNIITGAKPGNSEPRSKVSEFLNKNKSRLFLLISLILLLILSYFLFFKNK